ncbi:MAG: hypothetical protein ACI8PB_003200 [Desulforhopalus sp.]|jgi:hypothetical protein
MCRAWGGDRMKSKRTAIVCWLLPIALLFGPVFVRGQVVTYTNETVYLNALKSAGYNSFKEGFEVGSVWGVTRAPGSAASVNSSGIGHLLSYGVFDCITNHSLGGNRMILCGTIGRETEKSSAFGLVAAFQRQKI